MVSVIVPCYNQAHYLAESLNSVLSQFYTDWECILVDDGSSDNTREIGNDFVKKDNRFKYIYKSNGGLSSARNAGLDKAAGSWIQFLDADDTLEPEKFSKQLNSLSATHDKIHTVCYTDYRFGEQNDIYKQRSNISQYLFYTDNRFEELIINWEDRLIIPCHSFLFSSDFFTKDMIRFDESLGNHEDFDCWLKIFSKHPEVFFVDEILCRYRLSNNSMSGNIKLMGEGFIKVLDKHLKSDVYQDNIYRLMKKKRLLVLQNYKRFDLMSIAEKLRSWKILKKYYCHRIIEKLK